MYHDRPTQAHGMTAKTPAQRQAERRARGAKAVLLPGDVLAQLDALRAYRGDGTRVECIRVLIQVASYKGYPLYQHDE